MATWGHVVTQYPDIESVGGTKTQPVTVVGIETAAHQTYIEFRIPDSVYNETQVNDYGIGYSATVDQPYAWPGVVGVEWAQSANAANKLTDVLTIYVQSDSGRSQASVTVPL